ncbi:hypothetical protein LJC56_11360 [Christensenellaceae bacterium OttesenSCG-928-K19]|nr:hypothetical protein [Christensenellaceae bacterium OttesenSCG-928-K19]
MKGVSEFAKEKRVSTAAVSNHLKRYQKELKGHIIQQGRRKFLDDFAIEFLSGKISGSQIIIYDSAKDEEIQQLQTENKQLHQQLIQVQQDFLQSQEKTHALEMEKLQIEGDKRQEETARGQAESAKEQAEKKLRQLQARRLTFKERFFGRLEEPGMEE